MRRHILFSILTLGLTLGFGVVFGDPDLAPARLDSVVFAQEGAQRKTWAKRFVHPGDNWLSDLHVLPNGRVLALGGLDDPARGPDVWLLRLNSGGQVILDRTIDTRLVGWGSYRDVAEGLLPLSDGGYLVPGGVWDHGDYSGLVMKLDAGFKSVWHHLYGAAASSFPWAFSAVEVSDGYIVAGSRENAEATRTNLWVFKLDLNGAPVWNKRLDYRGDSTGPVIRKTPDGGFVIAHSVMLTNPGNPVALLIKFDAAGEIEWEKTYGDENDMTARGLVVTPEGEYVVAGRKLHGKFSDAMVMKLDPVGNVVWEYLYGGKKSEFANDLVASADGGYLVAGMTSSFGNGQQDGLLFKLDANGALKWMQSYGTKENETLNRVAQGANGNIVAGGEYYGQNAGARQVWLIQVSPTGRLAANCALGQKAKGIRRTASDAVTIQNFAVDSPLFFHQVWRGRVKDVTVPVATECMVNP